MTTALFSDSMELDSMFSPAPFSKADEQPDFFDDSGYSGSGSTTGNAEHRARPGTASNNLPLQPFSAEKSAAAMSQYAFTPVNSNRPEVPVPAAYSLSLSTDMSAVPVSAACFPPSATLMSPEDMPSPDFDFPSWEPSAMDEVKPLVQDDGSNDSWMNQLADFQQPSTARGLSHQRRYGQLTPPDDLSPKTQAAPDPYVDADGTENTKSAKESSKSSTKKSSSSNSNTTSNSSSSKRRSTKASGTNSDPSAPAPKRARKSRRSTKASSVSSSAAPEALLDPEDEAKRERFLERNRVAASKCRQKKKEWTSQLEDDERQQKALNTYLRRCVAQLKEELLYLKGECLRHSDCDCEAIRKHMASTIPMMQRPSQVLYEPPPVGSMRDAQSEAGMHGRRSSFESDMSSVDDDMRELLNATLVQDAPE